MRRTLALDDDGLGDGGARQDGARLGNDARAGRGESRRAGRHRRLDRVTRAGVERGARVRPDRERGHRERRSHPRSINSTPTGVFSFLVSVYPLSPHARSTRALSY